MAPSPTRSTPDSPDAPNAAGLRRARVEARRAELLEGAIGVIRARGAAASMEEIAAGCGVTKPILYRHFGDRDGLVQAIAVWFATDLVLDVAAYIRSVHEAPTRTAQLARLSDEMAALGAQLVVVEDTVAAARHAAANGYIASEDVRSVMAEGG